MTTITSSFAFQAMLRKSLLDVQRALAGAQQELSSGRHSDLSLSAGAEVGRHAALGQTLANIESITETNKRVSARLDASGVALSSLKGDASDLRGSLLRAMTDGKGLDVIRQQATAALSTLVNTMNSAFGGDYLFAGENLDRAPINQFSTNPPSTAKASIDNAFLASFGVTPTDPAVVAIPRTSMEAFLNGAWPNLFDQAAWQADWSNASNAPLKARISPVKTIDASVTANDPALRNLAMGYSALSQLALDGLSPDSAQAVIASALHSIDRGLSGITELQTTVGGMQGSIRTETETLSLQKDYLLQQVNAIEGVDPTEAAARINSLMTQLETAYTMTAKLQQLSLTRYL